MHRRSLLLAAAGGLAAPALLSVEARAQAGAPYPNHAVRLIVPWPPGQATDVIGRLIANVLSGPLGQPVVPENRPGANAALGAVALKATLAWLPALLLGGVSLLLARVLAGRWHPDTDPETHPGLLPA